MKSSLTILFEALFWIGLYERIDGDRYEVCKITLVQSRRIMRYMIFCFKIGVL